MFRSIVGFWRSECICTDGAGTVSFGLRSVNARVRGGAQTPKCQYDKTDELFAGIALHYSTTVAGTFALLLRCSSHRGIQREHIRKCRQDGG